MYEVDGFPTMPAGVRNFVFIRIIYSSTLSFMSDFALARPLPSFPILRSLLAKPGPGIDGLATDFGPFPISGPILACWALPRSRPISTTAGDGDVFGAAVGGGDGVPGLISTVLTVRGGSFFFAGESPAGAGGRRGRREMRRRGRKEAMRESALKSLSHAPSGVDGAAAARCLLAMADRYR